MAASDAISQAAALRRDGRPEEAAEVLTRAASRPAGAQDAALNLYLGDLLLAMGRAERALFYFDRAAARGGATLAAAHAMAGNALALLGRDRPAEARYRAALEADGSIGAVHGKLGALLARGGRIGEAIVSLRRAVELGSADAADGVILAGLLGQIGDVDEAMDLLRAHLRLHPGDAAAMGNLAYLTNCSDACTPADVLTAHARLAGALRAGRPAWALAGSPPEARASGPVRVALLSPDLGEHAAACFAEPLVVHRDRAAVHLTCVSLRRHEGPTAARLRSACDAWHDAESMDDDAIAELLRHAGCDVLIDLAGVTAHHRLGVVLRRPARLHLTAIGYPCTTGLEEMDLRLVDAVTDPPGTEGHMTERPLRLDGCFLCYRPPDDAPEPRAARAEPGAARFGSFNNLSKLSGTTLRLWARVLEACPGSRLVLKSRLTRDPFVADRVRARCAEAGIDPGRLDVLSSAADRSGHLAAYGHIDVALDTTPYNGTTTTCEALWMGVPVVALAGDRHAARVGASLLAAAGCGAWVAGTPDAYVQAARSLAAEGRRNDAARASLRAQVRCSALCDGPAYTAGFYGALRSALEAVA
ncbi:MAG: hypothetical protein KIT68_04515 [Phycisphaeraceae bacterium]|nr:hypothetical protein [Phycisphaeraceae bacterium]